MNYTTFERRFVNVLRAHGRANSTIDTYKSCLKKFFEAHADARHPKYISSDQITAYIAGLRSAVSQRQTHGALGQFYKYVMKQPRKLKNVPFAKRPKHLPVILSLQEAQRIIMASTNLKHKTIIALLYGTGMRVGELVNMTWDWVDRHRMVVRITGKGNKQREVPMDQLLLDLLEQYYRAYRPHKFVIAGAYNARYTQSSIRKVIRAACKRAGVRKKVTPHTFRHSYATYLLEQGYSIRAIQKLLGHGSIKTTQIYTHVTQDHLARIESPIGVALSA